MEHDAPFRAILLVLVPATLAIGAFHRIRSQASGEKLDRRAEGLFILVALRLLGLLLFVGLIAYLANPAWMAWGRLELPPALRWIGVGLAVVSMVLVTWVFLRLGRNLTDTVVTRREHVLVTTGPYRWVRHPFYVTAGLWALALCLITASWALALPAAAALALLAARTRIEEEKLAERFGEEYRRYCERTGKFFPRLWR